MAIKDLNDFLAGPGSIPDVIKIEPDETKLDPAKTEGRRLRQLLTDIVESALNVAVGGTSKISRNIIVQVPGGSLGGYENNDILAQDTDQTDAWEKLLRSGGAVTYALPSATLTRTPAGTKEIGEKLNLNFALSYNQRDAGALLAAQIFRGTTMIGATNPFLLEDFVAGPVEVEFYAMAQYATGPVKSDALGNPQPTGRILAGSVKSNTIKEKGYHKIWVGPVVQAPTAGHQVRTILTGVFTNALVDGKYLILNTGTVDVRYAVVLPPDVELVSVLDLDTDVFITAAYELIDANFTGQDAGGNPVPGCSLFVMSHSVPYSLNHRHQIEVSL